MNIEHYTIKKRTSEWLTIEFLDKSAWLLGCLLSNTNYIKINEIIIQLNLYLNSKKENNLSAFLVQNKFEVWVEENFKNGDREVFALIEGSDYTHEIILVSINTDEIILMYTWDLNKYGEHEQLILEIGQFISILEWWQRMQYKYLHE